MSTSPAASATPATSTSGAAVPGVLVTPPTPIVLPADALISAPSRDVVWVLIDRYLYRSTDRGSTWQQRPVAPYSGGGGPPEVSFVDDHQGWAFFGGVPETQCNGAGAEVWRTADAGGTWQLVANVQRGSVGYAQCKEGLSFIDPRHGFLGADDPNRPPTLYRTSDGGVTWSSSTLPDPPGFVTEAGGFTLHAGLVKGFNDTLLLQAWGSQAPTDYVFRSTDGGASWKYLSQATEANGMPSIAFVTATRWLQIGNDGSGLETTDAGQTWHAYRSDYQDAAGVASLFVFGDSQVGYGTVRGGIQRTVDGGLHWVQLKTPGAYQPG